jgi:hypothetical protein
MFQKSELLQEMLLCVYNMIFGGRRGRKPGYIHEMGSHDLKSCEVKCQRNKSDRLPAIAGLADEMQKRFKRNYIADLWR